MLARTHHDVYALELRVRGIYSHVTPAMNQRIVDALEGRWSGTARRTAAKDAPAA
jgi:hypothetical protein